MKIAKMREILEILEKTHPEIECTLSLDSKGVPNFFQLWQDLRNKGFSCYIDLDAKSDCQINIVE